MDERQLKDLRPVQEAHFSISVWFAKAVPLVLVLVFIWLFYQGYRQQANSLLKEGVQVVGKVSEAHYQQVFKRGVRSKRHFVTATYTVGNRTFTLVDDGTLPPNNPYRYGDTIPIICLPSNPSIATFDAHDQTRFGEITMLLAGIGIVVSGAYARANFRKGATA